jgi:uncharacterized protein (TIGR02217 family)
MNQLFRDVSFPVTYAYGADGGPEWSTDLFTSTGGWEARQGHWPVRRGRWQVTVNNRDKAEVDLLLHFFRAVAVGRGYSFRFRDFTDYQFNNTIALGDGSTTAFQLQKRYETGTLVLYVPLTKPVAASLIVAVNGVQTVSYTLDAMTGVVTFPSPPVSGAVIAAAGEFDRTVRFGEDTLTLTCVAPGIFSATGIEVVEVVDEEVG